MSIITKMLKGTAVYWAPIGRDKYGQPTWTSSPVQIKVRWQDVHEEFMDAEGDRQISIAKVFVGQDVVVKGVLLRGDLTSSVDQDDPKANDDAWEIRKFNRLPNFKETEFLRTAFL